MLFLEIARFHAIFGSMTHRILRPILRLIRGFLATGLAGAASMGAAVADPAATDWVENDFGRSRLVAAYEAVGPAGSGPVLLAWQVALDDDWKTYWRTPGEAGLPPVFDFSGSINLAAAEIRFPLPERFELFGIETYGYGGLVTLPIEVTPAEDGGALKVAAKVDYMVCKDICVPLQESYALTLEPAIGAQVFSAHRNAIFAALKQVPQGWESADQTLSVKAVRLTAGPDTSERLTVIAANATGAVMDLIVELPAPFEPGKRAIEFAADGSWTAFTYPILPVDGAGLGGEEVILTLFDQTGAAIERRVTLPGRTAGR